MADMLFLISCDFKTQWVLSFLSKWQIYYSETVNCDFKTQWVLSFLSKWQIYYSESVVTLKHSGIYLSCLNGRYITLNQIWSLQ